MINMDFQNNYREKIVYELVTPAAANKIDIITQHEIATLLFFISCVKNKFRVP